MGGAGANRSANKGRHIRDGTPTGLFAEGRNAVQVQRWLGHHSAAFTLATYVHLLDGDLGEPLAILQNVRNDAK